MDTVQMCALELVVVVAAARMRLFINANHQDGKRKKRLAGRRVVTAVGLDRIEVTLAERERERAVPITHTGGGGRAIGTIIIITAIDLCVN